VTQPPEPTPFTYEVRGTPWRVSLQQAPAAAEAAAFKRTARSSRSDRMYVRRKWNEAASIRPMPGDTGVSIRPAWTTGQIVLVVVVLFVLFLGFDPGTAVLFT